MPGPQTIERSMNMKAYKASNSQVVPQISWGMLVRATDNCPFRKVGALGICTGLAWSDNSWKIHVVREGCIHAQSYHLDFWEYYGGY